MIDDVKISPPTDVLDAYIDAARRRPKLVQTSFRRRAVRVRRRVLDRVTVKPGPPKYPLRWASLRQRRHVMAKLRAENNLPYARTDEYVSSFDVTYETEDFGGFLTLVNDDPKALYVGGDEQQPFHIDTGWVSIAAVVADERVKAEDELIETWFTLEDEFAGVR